MKESSSYRVWLAPLFGRPVREARAHRIVAEADQPPRVEIFGPADRLELPTPRPIEVGFSASDDFGLGRSTWSTGSTTAPSSGSASRTRAAAASAQGKTVFEPNLESSGARGPGGLPDGGPGQRRRLGRPSKLATPAGQGGPRQPGRHVVGKTGSSRTLYVVIQDPRENLDEQLLREREVLDKLLDNLADRLEALEAPPAAAGPSVGPARPSWRCGWRMHEAEESQVAALGRVIDDERRAGSSRQAGAGVAVLDRRPAGPAAARGGRAAGRRCAGPVRRGDAGGRQLRSAVQGTGGNTSRSWRPRCCCWTT